MLQYNCPHCHNLFSAPTAESAAQMLCPHCKNQVEVPATNPSRWFLARNKKRHGPYTWRQLLTLARRGDLKRDDLLLKEGEKQWERAASLPLLFASNGTAATKAPTPAVDETPSEPPRTSAPSPKKRQAFPWLAVILALTVLIVLLSIGLAAVYFFNRDELPDPPRHVNTDRVIEKEKEKEKKKPIVEPIKPYDDAKKKKPHEEKDKKEPVVKPSKEPSTKEEIDRFLASLNRARNSAGLGDVALDAELTRGCQAHAKYLTLNLDMRNADVENPRDEDPKKAGYSPEGEQAGRNSIFTTHPPMTALERWLGRVSSRVILLNPEIQSIGIGVERLPKGDWFCVVDAVRGRGEQVVVYPARNQSETPISFSGGFEVPDAKASAGFPISVSFPFGKPVTEAQITLTDAQDKLLDAWIWTPEKPVRPGQKLNAIGFIPKEPLQPKSQYQAKASAQFDGKPWNLAWSFTTDDDSDGSGVWAKKALNKVNTYRKSAGLKPVVLDETLSAGCLKHARYLVINDGHPSLLGLNAHKEDQKLPGASPEGNAAGQASNIAIGDYEPIDAVDSWLATLYHRVPVLAPNLRSIGFACVRGRRQGWATVMNVQGGRDKSAVHAVFYPAADQTDVPVSFPNGGEEPNPIPDDPDGRAGFPITGTFPFNEQFKNVSGKLMNEKGDEVPSWFSSPEKPANKAHAKTQGNTICLITKGPLAPKATYHVEFKGSLAGKAWEKKWTFATGDAGPNPEAAAKDVVDRLNHYRALAGVPLITSDAELSRGCQLHAEYLAKNADALAKSKASVNDEDPELPWFTAEGLKSARQSFVFSNAPIPVMQIDDLMATFTSRVGLLEPNLQRVGFGAAHDVGRGWRCVLDPNGGRGDGRIVVYPAPKQENVPLLGFDRLEQAKGNIGFPITVVFPQRTAVRNAQAILTDADKKNVEVVLSSPEKPLDAKAQRNVVGVHPLAPLNAGQTYSVTVSAVVNGKEWRQSWQFTTVK